MDCVEELCEVAADSDKHMYLSIKERLHLSSDNYRHLRFSLFFFVYEIESSVGIIATCD